MAQITLNSTGVASSGALVLQSNGTTTAVTVSTGQVATLVNDAVVNGLTVGRGAGAVATNTAVGASALAANTSGASNTAIGSSAMLGMTSGGSNSAFGESALKNTTTANANSAFGSGALLTNTTGANNTSVGQISMFYNTTGGNNTAVGVSALQANTNGNNQSAFGYQALYSSNRTADNNAGNSAFGYQSAYATTTGQYNSAFGWSSLAANTTGDNNVAVGMWALKSNTTGATNTAVGREALQANTTASNNTAVGYQAGYSITTGAGNFIAGQGAGYSLTTGTQNTFVGAPRVGVAGSGDAITTGSKNTILGSYNGNQGGLDIRTASNYIVLSDGDGNPRGIFDNSGNFLAGKTSTSATVAGFLVESQGDTYITAEGVEGKVLYLNRLTSDGDIVQFAQANTTEGSISVSGTTVSYNGGHLSRWAQTTAPKDESLLKGTVLSNLDAMNVYTDAEGNPVANEQLNKVKVSDVEGDANVAGVFVNWTYDEQHSVDEINMAMTGDMIIRIAQGVTVSRGDLLMSAGNGTAKPQGDDIVRSKTVAKVTSTHVTCTYPDGSFCVPCVLMAC